MMASIILVCGYDRCTDGSFETSCTEQLPSISKVMGFAPINKLYAMMLTFFAITKVQNIRVAYDRIQSFTSSNLKLALFFFGAAGVIFGPAVGYFDTYDNHEVHCNVTLYFIIGEAGYFVVLLYILNKHKA